MKTEINIYVLFAVLLIHWFCDFVLQTDQQAKNKSTSNYQLTMHVLVYSVTIMFFCFLYGFIFLSENHNVTIKAIKFICLFPLITFVFHWITDYFTSRLNTRLYKKGNIHLMFVSIGIDQIFHYAQLILTFQLLTN